jgi:hypothetical protein
MAKEAKKAAKKPAEKKEAKPEVNVSAMSPKMRRAYELQARLNAK